MVTRRNILIGAASAGLPAVFGMGCGSSGVGQCATAPAAGGATASAKPSAGPRSILILGGTNFLGPHIVDIAKARGHKLTLFNRGKTNPGMFPDVEKLHGDRDGDLKSLEGRTWDAVVDTSGYVPRIVKQSATLLAPKVGQYIFISSISVYKDDVAVGADENHPLQVLTEPGSEDRMKHYGALKALCEKTVAEAFVGRTLAIRPGLIVGPLDPTDRFTYWPVRLERGGEVLAPGNGKDPAQIIDGRDLAAFIVESIEQKTMGTFNATGPKDPITMHELLDHCHAGIGGSSARFTWVDTDFLEKKEVAPWTDLPVWTGKDKGMASVSSKRAIEKGLKFRPITETAGDTLAWWKTLPPERREKPKVGLTPQREVEVLAAWKARSPG
ncbi:MAG: NAD-dependent epimerase/dehydratase family protein [Polyangiaceae bacterium]